MAKYNNKEESVISTEKTSEKSHFMRRQNQHKIVSSKKVHMSEILKKLHVLKTEVRANVLDEKINEDMNFAVKNNVIHLRQLDSK